jgi:selenoprotein W-related protein
VSLADLLLSNLKFGITSLEMVPAKGGVFEVDVDGERVYSKKATGQFPDESDVLARIQGRS